MRVESAQQFQTHRTLAGAIEHARALQKVGDAAWVTEKLSGTVIEQVCWEDRWAEIGLSSGDVLTISAASTSVVWELGGGRACRRGEASRVVQLQFANDPSPWDWNRAEHLEWRIGQRFVRLFESDFGIFLYVECCAILLFSSLASSEDRHQLLLFWDETD